MRDAVYAGDKEHDGGASIFHIGRVVPRYGLDLFVLEAKLSGNRIGQVDAFWLVGR